MALETSPAAPAPVRQIALAISGWVDRLGPVWVEGQMAQISRRPGLGTVFMTLRDSAGDISIPVTCARTLFDSLNPPLVEGASVVIHAKPDYYANRGSLSLVAREIRMVGLGELLARLERRRQLLAAEGLFAPELKRPLPFLPGCIGLVTAQGSAAERDIVDNARRRWPGVRFETAYAAMQGSRAANDVIDALARLERHPDVDVIVVARGGGSVEDLLPFSDEALIRAVAGTRTPVVSAIGHEPDTPLLDLVADVRASTPTDAAKQLVPDMAEELRGVDWATQRIRALVRQLVDRESQALADLRSRPVLADPRTLLDARAVEIGDLRDRSRRVLTHALARAGDDITHQRARARALSPLATLQRGYAVVQAPDGSVVASTARAAVGDDLSIRLADGRVLATTTAVEPASPSEEDHG
jgi:exodeoxyribonuclease VII large subunit